MLSIVYELPLGLHQLHKIILHTRSSCTCLPPLWSRGNIVASHLAGPGLIPGRVSFPGCGFWSVNFFRHTMHSKSSVPVVNLAERHKTLLVNKWIAVCNRQLLLIFKKAVPIHLLIIHCFISLWLFRNYKWLYHFIIPQVIFRHFFSVAILNELLRVCYNFNYPIEYEFDIINIFTEWNVVYNWGLVSGCCVSSV